VTVKLRKLCVNVSAIADLEKRSDGIDVIRIGIKRKHLFVSFELVLQLHARVYELG
jgi:hypothetical protein